MRERLSVLLLLAFLSLQPAFRSAQPANTITVVNQSGEAALVKVSGTTSETLHLQNEARATVHVAAGTYELFVRYGVEPEEFRFMRHDPFVVQETSTKYSEITINLKRVQGGNFGAEPIPQEEFDSVPVSSRESDGQPEPLPIPPDIPQLEQALEAGELPRPEEVQKIFAFTQKYYAGDWQTERQERLNREIDELNDWLQSHQSELLVKQEALESQFSDLTKLGEEIDTLKARLNDLIQAYNQKAAGYKSQEALFNESARNFESERSKREQVLDSSKQVFENEINWFQRWVDSGSELSFFQGFNRLYMHYSSKPGGSEIDEETAALLNLFQSTRESFARLGEERRARDESNLLTVKVTLNDREEARFIVDTGADYVTIPMSFVEGLNLRSHLGETVELGLAGGKRIQAPKLILPRLSVLGKTADNVEAVVLDEPAFGVDGLLGQSFLRLFNFQIVNTDKHQPRLEWRNPQ